MSGYNPTQSQNSNVSSGSSYDWQANRKYVCWLHVLGQEFKYRQGASVTDKEVEKLMEVVDCDIETREDKVHITFKIPEECAAYKEVSKSVQCCAYTATDDYLKATKGLSLHFSDKSWYSALDVVISTGLPKEHTFTVLNELVRPYKIGISRIFIKKGQSGFEETKLWKEVLGCNPMALTSTSWDNEMYLGLVAPEGCDPEVRAMMEEQVKGYRFEYRDDLNGLGPIVVFGEVQGTTNWSGGGGHASYYAPRRRPQGWSMACQFDWIENCNYLVEPPKPVYGENSTTTELDFAKCLIEPGGKTFYGYVYNYSTGYQSANSNSNSNSGSSFHGSRTGGISKENDHTGDYLHGIPLAQTSAGTDKDTKKTPKTPRPTEVKGKEQILAAMDSTQLKEFSDFCISLVGLKPDAMVEAEYEFEKEEVKDFMIAMKKVSDRFNFEQIVTLAKASSWNELTRQSDLSIILLDLEEELLQVLISFEHAFSTLELFVALEAAKRTPPLHILVAKALRMYTFSGSDTDKT